MKTIQEVLNTIILREHTRWEEASKEHDIPTLLQAIAGVKIAQELYIHVIQPVGWEHIEDTSD